MPRRQNNDIANILVGSLTYVLIVHPIACFLTLLTAIPSIVRIFHPTFPIYVEVCTLLLCIVPALVTTVIFVVDIVLVIIAQQRIDDATGGTLVLHWGPAAWMTGVAALCLWLGIIGLSAQACGCCGLWRDRADFRVRRKGLVVIKEEKEKDLQ